MSLKNFIECATVDEANLVDMTVYSFLDRMSGSRSVYCFKLREAKRK